MTEKPTKWRIIPRTRPAHSSHGPLVIALHCSGGTGRQWAALTHALGPTFRVTAPDLIGCGDNPHWRGTTRFRLADEARPLLATIDAWNGPVHLVGHSYGGGVALRLAIERPARIASLSLYEPTAFHVLKAAGDDGRKALQEIRALAMEIEQDVVTGACRKATRRFVDYWNDAGTFEALQPDVQAKLVRYIAKARLDFNALIDEHTPLVAYRRLRVPLRIMCGEHARAPTEIIARKLAAIMNPGAIRMVAGAGHMGPMSHAEVVVKTIVEHVAASGAKKNWWPETVSRRAA